MILANGVLYVLDKMMKPQFDTSIQAWLAARPTYRVFVTGLKNLVYGINWQRMGPSPSLRRPMKHWKKWVLPKKHYRH